MKRLLFLMMITLAAGTVTAQPKKSRVQQAQQAPSKTTQQKTTQKTQAGQKSADGMTRRMQLSYPVAIDMPEDVVWRRDIYREIDLHEDANAGLYYPVQPQGKQMNLFTYIFKLAQNGYINIYEYSVTNDGNDDFSDAAKVNLKTVLDNFHIFYEEKNGKIQIDNSDIPSSEVTKYYLKESAYYDQANSSFRIKPLALCPIMMREDDFGGEATKYPLFWVKYADLEPYLSRQTVMTSDVNNAAVMSMDDFFTLNKYKGKIYKTTNMLGKTLAQIAGGDSIKYTKEQQRIEAELEAFKNNIFGDKAKRDSLDSIANTDPKLLKEQAKQQKRQSRTKTTKVKSSASSGGGSSAPRVSVRRERH